MTLIVRALAAPRHRVVVATGRRRVAREEVRLQVGIAIDFENVVMDSELGGQVVGLDG